MGRLAFRLALPTDRLFHSPSELRTIPSARTGRESVAGNDGQFQLQAF